MIKLKAYVKLSLVMAIAFIIIAFAGCFGGDNSKDKEPFVEAKGDISFHFMMLGNGASGDSIYVKAGDNDILIDAGSQVGSIPTIQNYLNKYVTDNTLEYVIVTHGDADHIAGFSKLNGSIFDLYECKTIIDFPQTNKTTKTYQNYLLERADEIENGAIHYTALQCYKEQDGAKRVYDLSGDDNVTMEFLYNYYYENKTNDENDYSVCVQFSHGSENKFLFTGDLEKSGEEYLVQYNELSKVKLFKAGHHGSKTSSNTTLLKVIQPEICVISCAIGDSYDFPKQDFINRMAVYTSKIYVTTMANPDYTNGAKYTAMNGNVVVISSEEGVFVECSGNDTILKESKWFLDNRTWPSNGK
ncbi:MAG: MBL fold metallo-hydrolase [Clostridia bacterium]|nr:MBL fold metallo-hydrolase [Clostridia bacterium]